MSSVTESNLGLNYGWAYGESGWNTGMDDNLVKLGFTSRNQIKGILSAPPSTPSNGDAYIVGTSPTGLFSGNFGKVAIWDRTVWLFLTPKNHEVIYNIANGCDYKYDNGWVLKQEDELSPYVKVKDFTFSTGYTVTDQKQCLLNLADNKYYQWFGSLPKVVAAGTTPETTGGIGAGAWTDRSDINLRSELGSNTGAGLVGFGESYISEYMEAVRVPIEVFGAVGDYNPETLTGTDCSPAFALAKAAGVRVQLKKYAKYMITEGIEVFSGMDIYGDEAYSPEIYPKFSAPGMIMLFTNLEVAEVQKDISLRGFTLVRIGSNAEHGAVIDNVDNLNVDLKVISDGSALGGAFGVSPFYPGNRPSTNCYCKIQGTYGGNFMLQYGNVDTGTMEVIAKDSMREVIGIEPYVLAKYDITQVDVSANKITIANHDLVTGHPLIYSHQGKSAIPEMASRANYWFAIKVDDNTIKIANSKEEALAGKNITLSAFIDTHRLYKCGVARNITVKPSSIDTGDVPYAGSLTGQVIMAATSGGYHEGINISKVSAIERNPTSGSSGLTIYGAKNIQVDDFVAVGHKTSSIHVTRGFLHSISDSTGDISPSISIELHPDVVINNPNCSQFLLNGIYNDYGIMRLTGGYASSKVATSSGLYISATSDAVGSRAIGFVVDTPNATTPINIVKGSNNIDVNSRDVKTYLLNRMGSQQTYKTISTSPGAICKLFSIAGSTTVYAGQLYVVAKTYDIDSTETAAYWLDVIKPATVSAAVVSVVKQSGLTDGGGASFPSFTFSIDGSNNLLATTVGISSPNRTWSFYINSIGDLKMV